MSRAASTMLHHTYRFDTQKLELETRSGATSVSAPGLSRTWERGQPELPYDVVTLLVPQGARAVEVRARAVGEGIVASGVRLDPAVQRTTSSGAVLQPPVTRRAKPVEGTYPAALAEAVGRGALHGYQLLSVRVHPVRYETHGGVVRVAERIDLEIELELDAAPPFARERFRESIEARARETLLRLVDNPEALSGYGRDPGRKVSPGERGFRPSNAPGLEGSPVDYLIITNDALAASFQVLADWKTRRGVPAVVRTIEWIEANTRRGSDRQETVRNFIQDANAKWGVQWVLLAGDTDVIPARYGYSQWSTDVDSQVPTDLYYACLDGNWNLDGDALWGEGAANQFTPVDDTDMFAEVFVGRLPVSTAAEAAGLIAKITTYENPALTTYQNELLLLGEVLHPVDWQTGQAATRDGGDFCEETASFANGCENITKLYENSGAFPGSQPLTLQSARTALNAGPGVVNHVGHGFRYNMSCGDQSLVNDDAMSLTNGDQRFVLYMLNCTAAAFDYPCLGEAYLRAAGGAVAVLGSTRGAVATHARNYNRGFFEALYQNGFVRVGEAFVESRLPWSDDAYLDTQDHYHHFIYNLLGDPEMAVHTCALGTTAASFPASVGLGTTNITVNVTVDGAPRAGARVCLQKGVEEYVFGITDSNGDVTLKFIAETAGAVDLTVSGANMTTLQDVINVTPSGAAYVHVQSLAVDDDANGSSDGNGDGIVDAGETFELDVTFRNEGGATALGVAGTLSIAGPWAGALDGGLYTLGNIAPGATANAALRFDTSPLTPDGTVITLRFETTSGIATWEDEIHKVVHAPQVELTLLTVNDFAPGGNGDGVVQAGETFDLIVTFKNYGMGAADDVSMDLHSSDPDVTVQQGSGAIARVDPFQEASATFRVTESTVDENDLKLDMLDSHIRPLTWTFTLRPADPPGAPTFKPSLEADVLSGSWTPPAAPDVAGYHVYRALDGAGPWTRVTVDRTRGVAYFRDAALAPSTEYFYYVTAVDSSGNESAPSGITSISTNPAQLNGWPITLAGVSSCPAVVGDVTGDGAKEIVAGNDHLYAWTWQGIELRDDDGDAQTWGVFAEEVATVTAAVALAQIDPKTPGLEVFTTVWSDENKAFVVRGDGSIAGGWPQNPDVAGGVFGYWGSPAAMDVDADGVPELFAPAKNGNLYAWHADGTPLGAGPAFKIGLGTLSRCSPTFANLDADPPNEIVYGAPDGTLHAWNADGSDVSNFPVSLGSQCLSNTAIGDVDQNGTLDIVMITEGGAVHVVDSQSAAPLTGWPVALAISSNPISPSPALADFDFDGQLEIVVANNDGANSAVRIFDHQGNVRAGWPQSVGGSTSESSPLVADVSGDGVPDVMFGNESGFLYGWDADGNVLPGFPLTIGDFIRSTPFVTDVDADGDIDLVLAGWDRNVWIWDFVAPYVPAAAQWPTFKHDAQRSGAYDFVVATDVDEDDDRTRAAPRRAFLAPNTPNPFNPMTSIAYGVPELRATGAWVEVRLDVFDTRGRRVRQLVRGAQPPGTYRAIWDGRDDQGRRVPTGVYYSRLRVNGESMARKMLLLQ